MTPENAGPISRPFPLHRVTPEGVEATVEATPAERAALAADLGLPAIHRLVGRLRISGTDRRVRVAGRVSASVEQVCVVTLDPFKTDLDEEVDVEYEAPPTGKAVSRQVEAEVEADLDGPEPLLGDRIDLGAIVAEFLALGLDPYPRKPGAAFDLPQERAGPDSPFAALRTLRPDATDD